MGYALPKGFRFGVIESTHLRGHTGGEHIVDTLDDFCTGAEIVAEQHLPALSRLGFFRRNIGSILFQEDARVCQPELVDRLLYVAHQKTVLLFPAQSGENRVLYAVGVLIFVHQDLPVPAADLRRGSCGIFPGFSQQQVKGMMLQIAEIQNSAASLGSAIVPVKLLHQCGKSPGAGGRLGQVHKYLRRIVRKIFQLAFQSRFAGFSGSFDPFCQVQIHIFLRKHKPAVIDGAFCHDSIPGFFRTQSLKLVQGISQVDGSLFHAIAGGQLIRTGLNHMDLAVQIFLKVVNQELTPDGFRSVGHIFRVQQGQAGIEPLLRIQVASGTVIDLFDNPGHQTIVPA